MSTAVPCPRCGREIPPHILKRHEGVCRRLPLPDDLAREYRAGAKILDLANKYGVSRTSITHTLRHGGVPDMETRRRAPNKKGRVKPYCTAPKPKTMRPCQCCGMNLDHIFVPDAGNGLCAYCALEHRQPSRDWAVRVVG